MTFKEKVHRQFTHLLTDKVKRLQQQLAELKESTANETKSTAGDKYETTRALLQAEQDAVRKKIQEALEQQVTLAQANITKSHGPIRTGSLVKTNQGWFFICIALGKIMVDQIPVSAISPVSPLGKLLSGQTVNTIITIRDMSFVVEQIE